MGIHNYKSKNKCFNILLIKTYHKLRNFIYLKTKSGKMTNKVLYYTFGKIYRMEHNQIPFTELEKHLYKIASECIKRECKEKAV